jgi:hypothetical protein
MTGISFPFEILPRLNAQDTAFYAHNIVQTVLSVETSPTTRNKADFDDK